MKKWVQRSKCFNLFSANIGSFRNIPLNDQKVKMADTPDRRTGIKLLIQNLKKEFRIPENLEHYSEEDFQEAEKKYLKFCLQNGCNLDDRDLSRNKGSDDLDLELPVE